MYTVQEHLYYIKERTAPILEYCVCEAVVTSYYKGGYTEVCLTGKFPKGYTTPYWYKVSEVGKRVFYTVQEAAELARQETEEHEHTWGWLGPPQIPMRRTWEKGLNPEAPEKKRTIEDNVEGQISLFDFLQNSDLKRIETCCQ